MAAASRARKASPRAARRSSTAARASSSEGSMKGVFAVGCGVMGLLKWKSTASMRCLRQQLLRIRDELVGDGRMVDLEAPVGDGLCDASHLFRIEFGARAAHALHQRGGRTRDVDLRARFGGALRRGGLGRGFARVRSTGG